MDVVSWIETVKAFVEGSTSQKIKWSKGRKYYRLDLLDGQDEKVWFFVDAKGQIFKPDGNYSIAKRPRAHIHTLSPNALDGSSDFLYTKASPKQHLMYNCRHDLQPL